MTNIFTCIGRGHGAPALPATRQEWEAMRREPWLAEMCRRIEAGDEKLKRRLPIWTPHCAAFRDNHRAAADALKPLPRLMLDFDEKGHSAEILERSLALQKEGKWQVLLVEESVRRGTHVLIVLPDGMTPQEAQKRFSADVGFQADGALKDVSRCIYMVPEDHTLYVDEERLFNEELRMKNEESLGNEERKMMNEELPADGENSSFGGEADILHSSLPKRLPALIKLLVSRTPDVYKAAVAHAVFPALAAHLHRVRFKYIDNVEHEATLMNVLMAGTGAGKDCISEPINRIMADIRRRDEDNLRREREWKNEVTSKGANKDKRQRPEGLIIQEIDADMTNPAFVMRMAETDGHFLYTKLNEIDQFDALRGSGRGGQQFQIMCLAFDPGNRYGQTRVGVQSVTEKVTIRFNWNARTRNRRGHARLWHV